MFDPYKPYDPYGKLRKEQAMDNSYTHPSQLEQQNIGQLSTGSTTPSNQQQELGLRELLDRVEQTQYAIAEKMDQLEHVVVSLVGAFPAATVGTGPDRDRESLRDTAKVLMANNEAALQRFADIMMALNRGI